MTTTTRFLSKPIDVLYEDERIVVFDKPSGLLVIPTVRCEANTLVNIVNHQYASRLEGFKLHPCHRLDRETSGAIIFAKGKSSQKQMMELFKKRAIKKFYIAFVHGHLKRRSGELRSLIRHLEQKKFKKLAPSKTALARYKVLETKKMFSVVEVQPITGLTNQIRIQFSQLRHPLVGERKYAFARDYALKFRRTALHALRLEWMDPWEQMFIKIQSKLSKDMEVFRATK